MAKLRALALDTLQAILDGEAADSRMTKAMREVWPDIGLIGGYNGCVTTATVALLDAILGDGLASYLLYECGRNGRITLPDQTEHLIRSVDDIRAYLAIASPE